MPSEFIIGPQVAIGSNYFDQTQVAKAKLHGEVCPVTPPTDDNGLNSFILLHYYDLPLSEYITYKRTGDPAFLTLARKCADAWWKHPTWIKEGSIRLHTEGIATPPPRHAGIGGLILRTLDGRPEMWDWIVGYTQSHLNIWCKSRINNSQLWYGPREVAFSMQFAAWVAKTLQDSYPNASQIRAQLITDLENLTVNYTGRLQYSDGSWRESSEWVDADGGTMVNSMQPFIVGLLTSALVDVHQVVTSTAAKESAKNQILKACRHLYSDGPYAKDLIEQKSGKRVRGFHYFYHGGTTVNPTKYAKGDMIAPWTDVEGWWLSSARQAISTILPAFAYAYMLSGDPYFKAAYEEMYDSAYNGTDGARAFLADTAKNFNQHCRRVPASLAWLGGAVTPVPTPELEPIPSPTPEPIPEPTPATPSPDGTKATSIVDSTGGVWTLGPQPEFKTLRNNNHAGGGQGTEYKYLNKTVYVAGLDRNWYKWEGAGWSQFGPIEPGETSPVDPPVDPPIDPPPIGCAISAPDSISVPKNGSGVININVSDVTESVTVTHTGSDGQVQVTPAAKTATVSSNILAFQVRVKRQSRVITFNSPCGSRSVRVNVI